MTKSEFYKKIEEASANGKFPSMKLDELGGFAGCFYRDGNGHACVVGVTIPDDEYEPGMDDTGGYAQELYRNFPQLHKYIPEGMDVRQMRDCQDVHDTIAKEVAHKVYQTWPHDLFMERISQLSFFKEENRV